MVIRIGLLLILLLFPLTASAIELVAGPMTGFTSYEKVIIWLQLDRPGETSIEYWPQGMPQRKKTVDVTTTIAKDNTAKVTLSGLESGTAYVYRIKPLDASYNFKTQARWLKHERPPDINIVAGSCARIGKKTHNELGDLRGKYEIFNQMAAEQPEMVLWLGDNLYFRRRESSSPVGMARRYRHNRQLPFLQKLLQTGSHYAVWDDHDYGSDDADGSFEFKDSSLDLFKRYWANPSFGLPETPGIFTQLSFYDVDFFLLDDRYYRDADRQVNGSEKSYFGATQIDWLKTALLASEANFKIIIAGGQFLNDYNEYEGWNNFPHERKAFLDWLSGAKIEGVVFLSGDRHHSEMIKIERKNNYPLYELTCSPLTSRIHKDKKNEPEKPSLIPGTLVMERNYCNLEFSGESKNRTMSISVKGTEGQLYWDRQIKIEDLQFQPEK